MYLEVLDMALDAENIAVNNTDKFSALMDVMWKFFQRGFVYVEEEDPICFSKINFLRKAPKPRVPWNEDRYRNWSNNIELVTPCFSFFPNASVQS